MPKHFRSLLESKPPNNGQYYLVAIDGRGAAGKTSLSLYMQSLMPELVYVYGDDYFEPTPGEKAWGSFNEERFFNDVIKPLQAGNTEFTYCPYDWHRVPHISTQNIKIKKGLCLERSYSFAFDIKWDLKIWVETPRKVTLERGISRSTETKERAEEVWRELWKPMEDGYIKDSQPVEIADLVLDGTKPYYLQLD